MKQALADWCDRHASPAWRHFFMLHSTWAAIFWFLFYGWIISLYAFSGWEWFEEHPFIFMFICMGSTVTWGLARLTKQPGVEDAE